MVKKSRISTPDILPGEPGWEELQEKKKKEKEKKDEKKVDKRKAPVQIGNIVPGEAFYRIGRPIVNFKGDKKYFVWRYKRKIGEIRVENPGGDDERIKLGFVRLGGIGNFKHLIQDADFRLKWLTREQELLIMQKECYLCKKKLSKSSEPNLFHYNLFKKRTEILERAERVPDEVVSGNLTIAQGWEKFKDILEEGNRYYMSLEDTALICSSCAKAKGLR